MALNLYQEAIAEAKQLREMAEQNAKNKIIDAITPQIRALVEKRLIGEADDVDIEDDAAELEIGPPDSDDGDVEEVEITSDVTMPMDSGEGDGVSLKISQGAPVEIEVDDDGNVKIETPAMDIDVGSNGEGMGDDNSDLMLSTEAAMALSKILNGANDIKSSDRSQVAESLLALLKKARTFDKKLDESFVELYSRNQKEKVSKYFRKLLGEAISLRNKLILSERYSNNDPIGRRASMVFKEIEEMAKRRHGDLLDRLFEAYHEDDHGKGKKEMDEMDEMQEKDELDELDAILTLEPSSDEEAEEVEDLLGDLDVEVVIDDDEAGDDKAGGDDAMAGLMGADADDDDDDDDDDADEVVEIDESMLRRELRRLREATSGAEDPTETADAFGGGDVEDEVFVDVDEEDLLNALADELGDAPAPQVGAAPAAVAERLSRRRSGQARQLAEYRNAVRSLKGQLSEMNLFNAKLLYVNKLMQNRNLSTRQQKVIVEALDNAKTLREAKLLYKSLTSSLNKKTRRLSEGRNRRTLGSASKSARSAQRLDEGAGSMNRWAVLAGIKTSN